MSDFIEGIRARNLQKLTLRRFRTVMDTSVSRANLRTEIEKVCSGLQWTGSSKADMAEFCALGGTSPRVNDGQLGDPDAFVLRLRDKYGKRGDPA